MNNLRMVVIDWERKKKKELNSDLERVEVEIHVLTLVVSRDSFSSSQQQALIGLEVSYQKKILHKEEMLRQKSRAIWLLAQDSNTKYFHNHANKKRLSNVIWEAKGEDESIVYDNIFIQNAVKNNFQDLYAERVGMCISN